MVDEAVIAKFVGRFAALGALAARAVREKADDARALYGAAGLYRRVGDLDAALDALERASALAPKQTEFLFELGQTQRFLGRLEAAVQNYQNALEAEPGNHRARHALVQLQKQSLANNSVAELELLFAAPDLDGWRTLHIGHALAKTYEDVGDLAHSFEWLVRAKARRAQLWPCQSEREEALVSAILAASQTPPTIGEGRGEPIFVTGLPRSGTTLVDRILSSHPEVMSAGELDNFPVLLNLMSGAAAAGVREAATFVRGEMDWRRLGELYVASTRPITGRKPRFIDKAPSNYLSIGAVLRAMPDARIVCVRRNPLDSVLSNFKQLFASEDRYYDYVYALESVAHKFVQFDRVLRHWRNTLPPERYMELCYDDLVADQERVTRALLAFCALDWDEACLAFHQNSAGVATPSAAQVRQPMYASSVGRWREYGALLDPARRVLERAGIAVE
ncbi:MAG: sulfotransferase [Terricaulis sp.]